MNEPQLKWDYNSRDLEEALKKEMPLTYIAKAIHNVLGGDVKILINELKKYA